MKTKTLAFLIVVSLFIASCGSGKKAETTEIPEVAITPSLTDTGKGLDALSLMETFCYSCHSPDAKGPNRVAPPMFAVRTHYLADHPEEAEFVNSMVAFLQKPTPEKAKLKNAVEKFGLMPSMSYSEEHIRKIAAYLYHNEQAHPGNGNRNGMGKGKSQKSPAEMGMHFALTTKAELGKNLMAAIQGKGTAGAVDFCNTRAIPLTDSMAKAHQVNIKRVSDKPRNASNRASMAELKHIATFKQALELGEKPTPIVEEDENQIRFYAPILTNQMCLQCHGTPEKELSLDVLKVIRSKYPDGKAIGYGENQVRGIWAIEWKKM